MEVASPEIDATSLLALRPRIEHALLRECQKTYADRLIALVGYGSVARGEFHASSDFDVLVVLDPWHGDNRTRWEEFCVVESGLEPEIDACRNEGWQIRLAPVFKSRAGAEYGSPLFLDMVHDARILFDRDDFFARRLDRLRERLRELGSQRIWEGDTWYWDLKPDWKPGDVIEL